MGHHSGGGGGANLVHTSHCSQPQRLLRIKYSVCIVEGVGGSVKEYDNLFPSKVLKLSGGIHLLIFILYWSIVDFPGGSVVKNPPANAGDVGLIPG